MCSRSVCLFSVLALCLMCTGCLTAPAAALLAGVGPAPQSPTSLQAAENAAAYLEQNGWEEVVVESLPTTADFTTLAVLASPDPLLSGTFKASFDSTLLSVTTGATLGKPSVDGASILDSSGDVVNLDLVSPAD